MGRRDLSRAIALAFLAGPWKPDAMARRARDALDRPYAFLAGLAKRVHAREPRPPQDLDALSAAIDGDRYYRTALSRLRSRPRPRRWAMPLPASPRRPSWLAAELPDLRAPGDVARWLELPEDARLDWLADPKGLNRAHRPDALRHYAYRWIPKRSGAHRLIEAPKPILRRAQRRILDDLLVHVPLHDAAHGFRRGRSAVSYAAAHARKRTVVRLDLEEFFNTISGARVRGIFRALGYAPSVAGLLAGLTCTRTPRDVLAHLPRDAPERFSKARRLSAAHLPQGAPTSPALANLAAFRLDVRLAGLARASGATYTRYADDLAFSFDHSLRRATTQLVATVGAVVAEEGFALRFRKTRVMRSGRRQELAGIVVNEVPTVRRRERERLEAILTNCIRHGACTQNRDGHADFAAHLRGRVAWVESVSPKHGAELRRLFDAIAW